MKDKYESPVTEVIEYKRVQDIVTASGNTYNDPNLNNDDEYNYPLP